MKHARDLLILFTLLWVSIQSVFANPIYYESTDLGAGRYEYNYTVDNQTTSAIEEFTIWFDLGLYDNLLLTGSPTLDWDGLAVQPDPLLPDDGFADWLTFGAMINPGESLGGFTVEFDWLGSGTPGSQFFEIIDPIDYSALSSGFTQVATTQPPASVPEPDTWLLMIFGLALLGVVRFMKQRNLESKIAVFGSVALLVFPFSSSAATTDLTATDQQLVGKQRAGRFYFDYTYTLNVNNAAEPMTNVVATVTSTSPYTTIIDGEVVLGDLSGGDTISADTFTFRQNRRRPFDPGSLVWNFTGDAVVVGDSAPVIISTPPSQGSVATPFSYDVDATDADAGDTLTFTLSIAPSGMTIDATTGEIQWTPTNSGSADVDLLVTDSTGLSDRQIFLVTVNLGDNDQAPSLAPIADQSIIVGRSLQVQASASDPEGETIRYSLVNAPSGMAINPTTGLIQWTPDSAQTGSASVAVSASDPGLQTASTSFSLTVLNEESNQPPTIAPVSDQSIDAGTAISLALTASDPDANEILLFSLSGTPSGMQFDPISGSINWTPTSDSIGSYPVVATVTDSAGAEASTSFNINVNGAQEPPIAVDDSYILSEREDLVVNAPGILANDSDANNDPLSAIQMSSPTIGALNDFPGDGSFIYSPPAIPPMTIGLEQQCIYFDRGGFGEGIAVGDVDADGDIELVSILTPTTGPEIVINNGATCTVEQVVPVGAGESIGEPDPNATVTLVNLDSDPDLEIVVPYNRFSPLLPSGVDSNFLMALNRDGSAVWSSATRLSGAVSFTGDSTYDRTVGPVPVDLGGDGNVELLQTYTADGTSNSNSRAAVVAYNGSSGEILWEYVGPLQRFPGSGANVVARNPAITDLDLDGSLEIIWSHSVLNADGSLKFLLPVNDFTTGTANFMVSAVANFDNDPYAEIIATTTYAHYMFEHTGALKWRIDRDMGSISGSRRAYSLITVAQLDNDNLPEYVVNRRGSGTAAWALHAYDTDGTELWNQFDLGLSIENSLIGAIAPVAFDFDRDGIDELVVQHPGGESGGEPAAGLIIFSGEDGSLIAQDTTNLIPGRPAEPLTIADIDGDGAAEIVGSHVYPSGGGNELRVFEGLLGNPFPAARPIRNQSNYQPNLVNDDGSIPSYPKPHWLIPGLNKFFATPIIPGETGVDIDAFTYVANDGINNSNEAVVDITLAIVNAPNIVSTAVEGGSPGFTYEYAALATDVDFGDILTWTLVDAPSGMTINEFGVISWQPQASDLGATRVQLVVTDSSGNTASQIFNIDVQPPVTVPNLLGNTQAAASDTLETSGLVVGNVTESFSLTVPAGEVLSQSVAGGSESAAGALIDYVISLGPPPIFVPDLNQLSIQVAEASLLDLGLVLGNVTFVNDANIPRGLVVDQSIAEATNVAVGTAVDIVVSGGPALAVSMLQNFMGANEQVAVEIESFSMDGTPTALPSDITVSVIADADATGALPAVTTTQIASGSDTFGGYTLTIASVSLGVSVSEPFLVAPVTSSVGTQASYAAFSGQLNRAIELLDRLGSALSDGDILLAQSTAIELNDLSAEMDLDSLLQTPAVALETGFFPDTLPDTQTAADDSFAAALPPVEAAIKDGRLFLEQLNQTATRNDDIRARFLNERLQSTVDSFNIENLTRRGNVAHAADLHRLLSIEIPKLLAEDLALIIGTLQAEGLLTAHPQSPTDFYQQLVYSDTGQGLEMKPSFFSLVGVTSASGIRQKIIKDLYMKIVVKIVKNSQNLVLNNLIKQFLPALDIPGITTGASLSFHSFESGHSVIEAYSTFGYPSAYTVHLIGPTLISDLTEVINQIRGLNFSSMRESIESFKKVKETADQAEQTLQAGFKTAHPVWVQNGCIFTTQPECQQLLFDAGLPIVHADGQFPAPVLIVLQDSVSSQISIGTFLFFPN
ncbi:MAG: putative Ig domain-containing protein [Candidatus Thiodiazotropha taylori]